MILLSIALLFIVSFNLFLTQKNINAEQLDPVEIREYEGERLSSLKDFNENAIKGTQKIDLKDYTLEITGFN